MTWWEELFTEPLAVEDGAVVVPERPGLGVDLAPRALQRFRA
jgi:L-alanine-DL-glutamate epimerase-like enolase superfamily enzyme